MNVANTENKKLELSYLETMVSWGCNLCCKGCSSFCDYPHSGFPDFMDTMSALRGWSKKLKIKNFGLIGGEPLLNPKLENWITETRNILQDSFIILLTNGTLYERLPQIIELMIRLSPGKIMITLQKNKDEILSFFGDYIKSCGYRFITKTLSEVPFEKEYILADRYHVFSVHFTEEQKFLKRYQGYGKYIYPYKSNIEAAHNICIDRPMLLHGRIYRCSKMALLERQLKLTGQGKNDETWNRYLAYCGIGLDAGITEIEGFIDKLTKAEYVCESCPDELNRNTLIEHLENVYTKREWLKEYYFDENQE